MDKLAAEVVKLKDVPPATVKHYGRIGELFTLLLELPVGEGHAIKVKCRDAYHAGSTNRDIRKKARKAAIAIQGRRVGSDYYCWRKA